MNASGVGPHLLGAFVYVSRGEEEKTQVRQPLLLHAARISKFSLRGPHLAEAAVWPRLSLSHLRLCKRKQSALLNRAHLLVSGYQRRMSFGCIHTTAYHNKSGLTHSASMRASAIGIHARCAPYVSRVYTSNFLPSPSAQS